jgi:uncharacterized protein
MRLTPEQRGGIVRIIRDTAGADASVWLYGSRVSDGGRGGDVDLLIRSSRAIDVGEQAELHARLERELSLPVDVTFVDPDRGMNRFQRLAAVNAVPLEAPP